MRWAPCPRAQSGPPGDAQCPYDRSAGGTPNDARTQTIRSYMRRLPCSRHAPSKVVSARWDVCADKWCVVPTGIDPVDRVFADAALTCVFGLNSLV